MWFCVVCVVLSCRCFLSAAPYWLEKSDVWTGARATPVPPQRLKKVSQSPELGRAVGRDAYVWKVSISGCKQRSSGKTMMTEDDDRETGWVVLCCLPVCVSVLLHLVRLGTRAKKKRIRPGAPRSTPTAQNDNNAGLEKLQINKQTRGKAPERQSCRVARKKKRRHRWAAGKLLMRACYVCGESKSKEQK